MDIHSLVALVFATVVLALTPGPVIAALVGRALWGGFRQTIGFLIGVFIGDLVWLLAALSGLGYLAASYATVFLVIKYIGALYLIYLGVNAIKQAMKEKQEIQIPKSKSKGAGFISGLLVTLGNPKLVAFYVGFLPTFIDLEALNMNEAILAAVLVPTTFVMINCCWALGASKSRTLFQSSRPLRILNFLSGGLLAGAGTVMLVRD